MDMFDCRHSARAGIPRIPVGIAAMAVSKLSLGVSAAPLPVALLVLWMSIECRKSVAR